MSVAASSNNTDSHFFLQLAYRRPYSLRGDLSDIPMIALVQSPDRSLRCTILDITDRSATRYDKEQVGPRLTVMRVRLTPVPAWLDQARRTAKRDIASRIAGERSELVKKFLVKRRGQSIAR